MPVTQATWAVLALTWQLALEPVAANSNVKGPCSIYNVPFEDTNGIENTIAGTLYAIGPPSLNCHPAGSDFSNIQEYHFYFGKCGQTPPLDAGAGWSPPPPTFNCRILPLMRRTSVLQDINGELASMDYTIPDSSVPTSETVTHILVFSATGSGDYSTVESDTYVDVPFHDNVFPLSPPQGIQFDDTDERPNIISGTVAVLRAADEQPGTLQEITRYLIQWGSGSSSSGAVLGSLVTLQVASCQSSSTCTYDISEKDITSSSEVPSGTTHFLAFSGNTDGFLDSPASATLYDYVKPVVAPAGVVFEDLDPTPNEISGVVTISPAVPETYVVRYAVYWGTGASSQADKASSTAVAYITATGSDVTYTVPADTPPGAIVTHFIVFAQNLVRRTAGDFYVEADVGAGVAIDDLAVPSQTAQAVAFTDADVDKREAAGVITITAAADESRIGFYNLYWWDGVAAPANIPADYLIATVTATGASSYSHTVPENTEIPNDGADTLVSVVLVVTGNDDGLMASGVSVAFTDSALPESPPHSLFFDDTNNNQGKISGTVTVIRAVDESDIEAYELYYGYNGPATFDNVAVWTFSGDYMEIGPRVLTSSLPERSTQNYVTFSVVNQLVPIPQSCPPTPCPSPPPPEPVTNFLAFSWNSVGHVREGVSLVIEDATDQRPTSGQVVSGIAFNDQNFDLNIIRGSITFSLPMGQDIQGIIELRVYLAQDPGGTGNSLVQSTPIPAPDPPCEDGSPVVCNIVLGDTDLVGTIVFRYFVVYLYNAAGAGDPAYLEIRDFAIPQAVVPSIVFSDIGDGVDLVSGTIDWVPATNPTGADRFSLYVVYVASDELGTTRLKLAEVPESQTSFTVLELDISAYTPNAFFLVYTANQYSWGESPNFNFVAIVDRLLPDTMVDNVVFYDEDLGTGEIGGPLTWTEPADAMYQVDTYRIYLRGPGVPTWLRGEVPLGSEAYRVPLNTVIFTAGGNYTELVVVASNSVGEGPANASVPIVDKTILGCPTEVKHGISSHSWRLVALGVASEWEIRAVRIFSDPLCKEALETVPRGWPRRPRQVLGSPFAQPSIARYLHEVFIPTREGGFFTPGPNMSTQPIDYSNDRPVWSTRQPCSSQLSALEAHFDPNNSSVSEAAMCYVGFNWVSDVVVSKSGRRGSTGVERSSNQMVHCIEVDQSEIAGHYAEELAVQAYDSRRGGYVTVMRSGALTEGGTAQVSFESVLASECQQLA